MIAHISKPLKIVQNLVHLLHLFLTLVFPLFRKDKSGLPTYKHYLLRLLFLYCNKKVIVESFMPLLKTFSSINHQCRPNPTCTHSSTEDQKYSRRAADCGKDSLLYFLFKYAVMKISILPSSTASTFPVSISVLWSFTIL